MKTQRYVLLLSIICLSFLLIRCSKDGAVGPQGDKGTQGLVGPAGPKGADGSDGSVIYNGNTAPTAATGKTGDFYLNTSTGLLYGPKTANGWGAGLSLKGATGAAGTAGSKTLSGTGAPAANLGNNGDYYLNKNNYLLYGPKTDAGWGAAISLQGPVGTANIIYSDWVKPDTYTLTTVFGINHLSYTITASKITQAILDNGAVMVYAKLNGYSPFIWPTDNVGVLPISLTYDSGKVPVVYTTDTWTGIASVGNVRIDFVNNINLYTTISTGHSFRYVIIPGGIHTVAAAHVNFNNYAEVKQTFHLTD